MKLRPITLLFICAAALVATNAYCNGQHKKIRPAIILKPDGPYLFYRGTDSIRYIAVTKNHKIIDTVLHKRALSEIKVLTNNARDSFLVKINYTKPQREGSCRQCRGNLFIISDPHSNFKNFASLLQKEGVINNRYEWRYKNNELIIIGDVFDRGKDATAIMWLIYKMRQEAALRGGHVTYLIGNHDWMVLSNDLRYTNKKYRNFTDTLKKLEAVKGRNNKWRIKDYSGMWSAESLLGEWIRSCNTIQKIGNFLFLHAGISTPMLDSLKSGAIAKTGILSKQLDTANLILSESLKPAKSETAIAKFLTTSLGPLWYRGMVYSEEKYKPLSDTEVEEILSYFGVEKIIVGHCTFDEISYFHSGKVIGIDNKNKRDYKDHLGSGLRITVKKENRYNERIIQ
jgi:hypothetical protein